LLPAYIGDPARRTEELKFTESPQEKEANPNASPARPVTQHGALVERLKKLGEQQKSDWQELLRTALDLAVNLLSGNETNLLSGNRPELLSKNKTALLSGNSPELLSKNNPKLLSGNKPKILSGNKTSLFSGNHFSFFSNLKIDIHIENTGNNNGNNSGNNPPPPPNADSENSQQESQQELLAPYMQESPSGESHNETPNP
jgi:hypothetical protein